jgi:hypothetical protein
MTMDTNRKTGLIRKLSGERFVERRNRIQHEICVYRPIIRIVNVPGIAGA